MIMNYFWLLKIIYALNSIISTTILQMGRLDKTVVGEKFLLKHMAKHNFPFDFWTFSAN